MTKVDYLNLPYEDPDLYTCVLCSYKFSGQSLSWQDISDIVYEKTGVLKSRHYYYRNFTPEYVSKMLSENGITLVQDDISVLKDTILDLKKERVRISDERSQNRAYVRRLAREDTIKDIAIQTAHIMSEKKELIAVSPGEYVSNKEAVLLLSDWHYGMEVSSHWNTYNTTIAKKRIQSLLTEVIKRCRQENVSRIHVLNLGDLIAGRIHLPIRLESRIDTITQIMDVSELLAEFLSCLSQEIKYVDYYSCTDNHSRVEPDKTQSLDLESLCRITDWYLKERLKNIPLISIHENVYSEDIITFRVLDHNIIAVHGDKDKPSDAISKLGNFTRDVYEAVLMSHRHHFTADEECGTLVIGNGALMGTDGYAKSLRLHSQPSQTLIMVTPERVADSIIRIVL